MKKINQPICLTIAGSDSGGGAGIQADLKTFFDLDSYGVSVISAVTAQNTKKVTAIEIISINLFKAQLEALGDELLPSVVKTGMLGSIEQVDLVCDFLKKNRKKDQNIRYICDPVMISTSKNKLVPDKIIDYIKKVLFPIADLITPNLDEALYLYQEITKEALDPLTLNETDLVELAEKLSAYYQCAVLLKGGHSKGFKGLDYFCHNKNKESAFFLYSNEIILEKEIHGSGCTLSAAICAFLAHNFTLENAVTLAKAYITEGIFNTTYINYQNKSTVDFDALPIIHCGFPQNKAYFPQVFKLKQQNFFLKKFDPFPSLSQKIGFYPIVDSSQQLLALAKLGVKTIQLRIKDKPISEIKREIKEAVKLQKKYHLALFINDYWQEAILYGAFGVHLGHEDLVNLTCSDLEKLNQSGLYLGLSTHDYFELALALSLKPSYIALGPIYPTKTKQMRFLPQGVQRIKIWQNLVDCQLVAIGGINLDNIKDIANCKVDGISAISLIKEAKDPKKVLSSVMDVI